MNGMNNVKRIGALATNTTITITQTSAGSPPLPGRVSAFGQMFAFTPHGTSFAVPVTMTLPFDPAAVPAGSSPVLGHGGLARYNTNGSPDMSFGAAGKLTLPNLALGEALALQADGKIVIAVSAAVSGSIQFGVMRLDASGSPDGTFGTGGLVTTGFSTQDDFARAVAVQTDGRIVVAGQSSNKSNPDFAVARYSASGAPDASFGSGGKLTISFFGSFDGAENVSAQRDGKIVLGGFARNGTRTGYGLARVLP